MEKETRKNEREEKQEEEKRFSLSVGTTTHTSRSVTNTRTQSYSTGTKDQGARFVFRRVVSKVRSCGFRREFMTIFGLQPFHSPRRWYCRSIRLISLLAAVNEKSVRKATLV